MDMLFKITGIAVTVVLLSTVLRKTASEQSVVLGIAFTVLIFLMLGDSIRGILDTMAKLAEIAKVETTLLIPVVKTVAISISSKITGELCRSAGESGTASLVEFSGAVLALVIALPLVEAVMEMMVGML